MAPVKHLATLLLVMSLPTAVWAQISPIRPGFSSGSEVVAPGEVELGISYEFQENASSLNRIPVTSVRAGVTKGMEVFVDWNGLQKCRHRGKSQYELPALGAKSQLVTQPAYGLSLIAAVAAENDGGLIRMNPFAGLNVDAAFTSAVSVFAALQLSAATAPAGTDWEWNAMAGVSWELTERVSLTGEWYNGYQLYTGEDYFVNQASAAFAILPGMALESYVGWSPNKNIPLFGGMGASISSLF